MEGDVRSKSMACFTLHTILSRLGISYAPLGLLPMSAPAQQITALDKIMDSWCN
jgi:hypothetical protein